MRDDDRRPLGRFAGDDAEAAAVRRRLEEAGPRAPLAEDDVELVTAATRAALRRRFGAPAGAAADEGPVAVEWPMAEGAVSVEGTVAGLGPAAGGEAVPSRPSGPVAPAIAGERRAERAPGAGRAADESQASSPPPVLSPAGLGRRRLAATRARRPAAWLPLAALLALALGLGAWWALSRGAAPGPVARVEVVRGTLTADASEGADQPLAPGAAVPRGTRLCTAGAASRARLRLAGGAELRLAGDSCVRAESAERVALLRGGVYADTGGDPEAGGGLAVDTPYGTVRDVGTRFAVRLLAEAVAVAVREGAVIVAERHRAEAGERLVLHRDGTVERRAAPPWGPGWSWVVEAAGGFAIEGCTLADFLAWATGESGWRLRYADPALAAEAEGIVLHGDLGALRPDEAPFVVLPGAGLEGRLEDGVLIVSRPPGR